VGPALDLGIPGYAEAEEIGRGGFATVYRARRQRLGDWVAIKLIDTVPDERALRRVNRELSALGRVGGHPNVVAVHDAGRRADGRPYIVMELVPGGTLGQQLSGGGPLPWAEVTEIGTVLAGALQWAHDRGVIHRDVKPENVLVDDRFTKPRDRIRLSDFGVAAIEGRSVTSAAWSVAHVAPEVVLDGAPPTTKADLYGLASTLYQLLDGEAPFIREGDETLAQVFARIHNGAIRDLRATGVPDPVATVIEQGLDRDPDARPETAAELATLLGTAAAKAGAAGAVLATDTTISAHPLAEPSAPGAGERRWPSRRIPVLLGGAASVLAGMIAINSLMLGDHTSGKKDAALPTTSSAVTSLVTAQPPTTSSSVRTTLALDDFVAFHDDQTGFSIKYPVTWLQHGSTSDNRLFISPATGDGEALSIRVIPILVPATTENLANFKAVTDGLVTATPSAKVLKQQAITLDGLMGYYYLYTYTDDATGVEAVHAHYFLFEGKRMFALIFQASPVADFQGLAGVFDTMAESFSVDRR
jgi:serine/threonine protein kinase